MAYNRVTIAQFIRTKVIAQDGTFAEQWSRWFGASLIPAVNNTTPLTIPGPFADDPTAAAAGVPIGSAYFQASGAMVVRLA